MSISEPSNRRRNAEFWTQLEKAPDTRSPNDEMVRQRVFHLLLRPYDFKQPSDFQLDTTTTTRPESENILYLLKELAGIMVAHFDIVSAQYAETKKISETLSSIKEQLKAPQRQRKSKITHEVLKIESDIIDTFSKLEYMHTIFLKQTSQGFSIVFIQDSMDQIKALEEIETLLSKLEDRFPHIYFEPSIFYIDDIDFSSIQGRKISFK